MNTRRIPYLLATVIVLSCLGAAASGCGSGRPHTRTQPIETSTPTATAGVTNPRPPVTPTPPDRSSPESAVRSYLEWVSYAYRTADSEVASPTMTAWEGVRVDSYIELNRQTDFRAIEQALVAFEVRALEANENTATLATYEEWDYRYFSMRTGLYTSDPLHASYDSTYTVVRLGDVWLVDAVEVRPLGEVK